MKTRKIQVTLDEVQYEQLAEIALREDKKLARVVREAIVRYCLEPAAERRRRDALDALVALDAVPVPDDYAEWEAEYGGLKAAGSPIPGEQDAAGRKRDG